MCAGDSSKMSHRDDNPDEPAEGEEKEELVQLECDKSQEPLEDDETNSAENELANTSDNESEQSFVGKIRYNVSSVLSRMIRTAKDRFVASTRLRDCEYDRSEIQPAKRRRLQEADERDKGFPEGSQSSVGRQHPLSGSRVDRSSQTNPSDTALATSKHSRTNHNALPGSSSVSSLFMRGPLTVQRYGESSVFRPAVSLRQQPTERGGKRQREENDEDVEEEMQEKREEVEHPVNTRPYEPFDPFKFLAQHDKMPIDPKRRLSGFLGNRCHQRRQQQLRRGVLGQYFFASHHKPTKNLDTASSSEADLSSHRPSFSRAAYRAAAYRAAVNGQRIPPEYGGSIFYNGLTCYGGASAANTLGTHYTATRSTVDQNNTVLVHKSLLSEGSKVSGGSNASINNVNVASAHEPVTPVLSTTMQRMMNIWQEYDSAKKGTRKVEETPTSACVRQELNRLVSRARPYAGNSCIPEMLHILREQLLASVENARSGPENHPPILPLINVRPLYANEPIERRDEPASSDRNITTASANISMDVEDPVLKKVKNEELEKLRDVLPTEKSIVQPATIVQQQQQQKKKQLPSETREDNVPKRDVKERSQSPPAVKDKLLDVEVSVLSDEDTDEQDQVAPLQKTNTSSPITSTVQMEEVQFTFAEPILMNARGEQGRDNGSVSVQLSIQFDEPELLQEEQRTIRSFHELMAESASKWICDVCMVRNEPHLLACVACESVKPSNKKQQNVRQQPPPPISTSSSSNSFAAIMSAQSLRWECDSCCVRNEPSAAVCICCGMAKSNAGAVGAPEKESEQPKKANDEAAKSTTPTKYPSTDSPFSHMPTKNPTTDSPFSNMPDLKDTFKSLLERQNTGAMWKGVYDSCQTPDANEQSSSSCEQPPPFGSFPNTISQSGSSSTSNKPSQPNDRFGAGSAFNGVHTFRSDPDGNTSNPFHSAATISPPLYATATTRREGTELPGAPPKPFMFTGFQAPAKSHGDAPLQNREHPFHGESIFSAGNRQTNANDNNAGISVLSWEKSDTTIADSNPFSGLFAQSAPPGGLSNENTFSSTALQSSKPVFQFGGVPQQTPASVQFPKSQTKLVARRLKHRGIRRLQS